MKTITVQIGNSDDKLTQKKWAEFVEEVQSEVRHFSQEIHFFAASDSRAPWQNCAWVAMITDAGTIELKKRLAHIRALYGQDSIAFTEGETDFI